MAACLRRALVLPLALASACVEAPPPAAPPPAPSAASVSAPAPSPPPSVPATEPRLGVELPLSTTKDAVPAGLLRVVLSRQSIVVENDASSTVPLPPPARWANGVDPSYKRNGPNDLYLVPLAAALERAGRGAAARLVVAVDASVPYRILLEVLFTAGMVGGEEYHLLVRTAAGLGAIVTRPPPIQGGTVGPPPGAPALKLLVILTSIGIGIKTFGGNIAPGCADVGPGITFPRGASGPDLAAVRACAARVKAVSPEFAAETTATLVANPDTPFGEIVPVIDALRDEPSGRPLFPDIRFGVVR